MLFQPDSSGKALGNSAFSVSCVTFDPSVSEISLFLTSLECAALRIKDKGYLNGVVEAYFIDNGPHPDSIEKLKSALSRFKDQAGLISASIITGKGNVGFGAGHNQCLERLTSDFHIVANLDVELEENCLVELYEGMRLHADAVLAAPKLKNPDGTLQYGVKSYPSVLTLSLRFLNWDFLSGLFEKRLSVYECRALIEADQISAVDILSGCFMFFKTTALKKLNGFDEKFFLYFEDFDISLRATELGSVYYIPSAIVIHAGGGAGRKGWRHIRWFVGAGFQFYKKHGWKFK